MDLEPRNDGVAAVVDWLTRGAPPARGPNEAMQMFCERIVSAGVPLDRAALFVRPLHPQVVSRAYYWQRETGAVEMTEEDHEFIGTDEQRASPIRIVTGERREIRQRLDGECLPFPIMAELRAAGFSDYLITPLQFIGGEVHAASFSTRRSGGFGEADIAAIHRVMPAFTRIVEIFGLAARARNVLDAYVGRHAGERVLNGRIRRGDVETIDAVIWFCDLRDSTMHAEALGPARYLALLNEYFEALLEPVTARDGRILSFIGDGALAIFAVAGSVGEAAARAVAAAREAIDAMERLNARRAAAGEAPLRFGIGLHVGDVLYGNIGTPSRLAFTVIGSAANEAARIESLCRELDTSLLVSEPVARSVPLAWRPCGAHALRGVSAPYELYTL